MQTIEELNDFEILSPEIKEYKIITNGKLEPLLLKCAEKLSAHYEDKSVIASKLTKIFPEQRRAIQRILPENYKRVYNKSEDEVPVTPLEEYLELSEENFKTIFEIIKDIKKKVSSGKYEGLKEQVQQLITTKKSLPELIEETKILNAELSIIKSKDDIREKIHPFQSLVLRASLFVESLHEVADKIDQSAKWANIGHKERSENIIKKISTHEELSKCIVCDWNSADWFNANIELEKRGLEIKIPDVKDIQNGFKDSKIVQTVAENLGTTTDNISEILTEYFTQTKLKISKKFTN